MSVLGTPFELAKKRLSDVAARLLAGDRSAIKEADETMAETERLRRETQINHATQGSFKGGSTKRPDERVFQSSIR